MRGQYTKDKRIGHTTFTGQLLGLREAAVYRNVKRRSVSFISITIHCVWATKNRAPVLVTAKRLAMIGYIRQIAGEKGIFIDRINGHVDHLHVLLSLGGKQNIADVMQQLKGASSFWANNESKAFEQRFSWADKYYAVSVSASQLDKVRRYIDGQEEHHKRVTFSQEYSSFLVHYGFQELG